MIRTAIIIQLRTLPIVSRDFLDPQVIQKYVPISPSIWGFLVILLLVFYTLKHWIRGTLSHALGLVWAQTLFLWAAVPYVLGKNARVQSADAVICTQGDLVGRLGVICTSGRARWLAVSLKSSFLC